MMHASASVVSREMLTSSEDFSVGNGIQILLIYIFNLRLHSVLQFSEIKAGKLLHMNLSDNKEIQLV